MFIVKATQKLLLMMGYELKKLAKPIYVESHHVDIVEKLIDGYTMLSNTRLVSLADHVAYCNLRNLEGSFVECGVWKGGAVALMAYVSKVTGRDDRELHLFDAFQDICAPDPNIDGKKAIDESKQFGEFVAGETVTLSGIYDSFGGHGTVEACSDVIISKVGYPSANVHFHAGWFKDTVFAAAATMGPIALLRLDGDWYESTKTCLDALYDSVVKGGIIIFDDYLTYDGCKKAVDEFFQQHKILSLLIRGDNCCYYIIKE
jgi:O-methyltransferase